MFMSAKAFFEDHSQDNKRILVRAQTALPAEFAKLYRQKVVKLTPIKTGALRRSIITQSIGNTAMISWRSPYAAAQNAGGHRVRKPIKGPNKRDGGFGTIMPGYYRYNNGAQGFADRAFAEAQKDMPAVFRMLGLTK